MNPSRTQSPQRRRWHQQPKIMFTGLIALFLLPMFLAWLMVSHRMFWGTVNHGRLLAAPISISKLVIHDAQHRAPHWRGHWWLVAKPADQGCDDAACMKILHTIKQIHVALPKYNRQIQRALLLNVGQSLSAAQRGQLQQQAPGTHVFWVNTHTWKNQILNKMPKKLAFQGPALYLMDPEARIVLVYPATIAGEPVMHDLKRLLKVSQYAPKASNPG